jgi:hypothetical protein
VRCRLQRAVRPIGDCRSRQRGFHSLCTTRAGPVPWQAHDRATFGAKSKGAQAWRAKLFSGDADAVSQAQAEGLRQLSKRLGAHGRSKWWAFEGFTHVDCCLIIDACVLFVEGTRTDAVSPSTRWFHQRSQVWRNVEAAKESAGEREFAMMLAVELEADGVSALAAGAASLAASYPQLEPPQRSELDRHLLGFVTWADVVTRFGLALDIS